MMSFVYVKHDESFCLVRATSDTWSKVKQADHITAFDIDSRWFPWMFSNQEWKLGSSLSHIFHTVETPLLTCFKEGYGHFIWRFFGCKMHCVYWPSSKRPHPQWRELCKAIKIKHPVKLTKGVLFHQENALAHNWIWTGWSPFLFSWFGYHLFTMKNIWLGITVIMMSYLLLIFCNERWKAFSPMDPSTAHRWNKCEDYKGDNVEKKKNKPHFVTFHESILVSTNFSVDTRTFCRQTCLELKHFLLDLAPHKNFFWLHFTFLSNGFDVTILI